MKQLREIEHCSMTFSRGKAGMSQVGLLTTIVTAVCLLASSPIRAAQLQINEIQASSSIEDETRPTPGESRTQLVVYTRLDASGGGDIYYQRLSATGTIGKAVLVSETDKGLDNRLPDTSGSFIVYTRYISPTSTFGTILLYDIPSGGTDEVSTLTLVNEAKLHGSNIAWVEGSLGATQILLTDFLSFNRGVLPTRIAGPSPTVGNVEIGDSYVVWEEFTGGQTDVFAYDLDSGSTLAVATDPNIDERAPATSGDWITWQADASVGTSIEARNMVMNESRTVVDDGSLNLIPTIDGDVIAYESDLAGNFDVYLYRLSTGETFQATTDLGDQRINNVFGDQVAYIDSRNGNQDIFVSTFAFVPERDIEVSPTTVNFGKVGLGSAATAIVTISNVGAANLTVNDILLGPDTSLDFLITAAPPVPIVIPHPNGTEDVEITYAPIAVEPDSGVLIIRSNAGDDVLVALSGEGVEVELPPSEQIATILDFVDTAVTEGTLVGQGPGGSAQGRLNALQNMIKAAGDLIEDGLIDEACQQLLNAFNRTDGSPRPPDFVEGSTASELATLIQDLRTDLGCL